MVLRIGLAMLQGARYEHSQALTSAAAELDAEIEVIELRTASEVEEQRLDALVLPGGETTTMRKAAEAHGLLDALFAWMLANPQRPVLGTCAGAILLSDPRNGHAPFIDASIDRNAYGRQRDSFQSQLSLSNLEFPQVEEISELKQAGGRGEHSPLPVNTVEERIEEESFPGVFIRAPRFLDLGLHSEVVARDGDEVVGIRHGSRLALTFHPELTDDRRFHHWLISQASDAANSGV